MSKRKRVRVAPIQDGRLLAYPWSFFAQGDEFYARSRQPNPDNGHGTDMKISFHSSGVWKFDIGTERQRLLSNFPAGGNWINAVHVHFLIHRNASRPPGCIPEKVLTFEVPFEHKLRVDILVSRDPPKRNSAGEIEVPDQPGRDLRGFELRNGNVVVVCSLVERMDLQDRKMLRSALINMPVVDASAHQDPEPPHGELHVHGSHAATANSVVVVPYLKSHLTRRRRTVP